MKRRLVHIVLGGLLLLALVSCAAILLTQRDLRNLPPPKVAVLNCPGHPPTVSVTTAIPASAAHTIYAGSGGNLYALNARTGAQRWCRQVAIVGEFLCPGSCPPPPSIIIGQPAVADGAVYVCASGYGDGQTYAFRASDGALLWRAISDCLVGSIFSGETEAPLVGLGIVYSGGAALRARDGHIIWAAHVGGRSFVPQALADGVLYGHDAESIYALDADNGGVRWKYAPPGSTPGGQIVAASGRVYVGMHGSGNTLHALDAANGAPLWTSAMAAASNPTVANGMVYLGSWGNTLYALQASDGAVCWRYMASVSITTATTIADGVAYVNLDGPYAFDATTGVVFWHQALGAGQNVWFTPLAVAGNVAYLGRTDGEGNSVIYALNAATGAIYWQTSAIWQVTPLAVV
ncbi:MAG TPA: PQQ-binding-like beta-propeller repeat protein [Ktedonobacterales bacterium]|jgi:outer membrane protein assembly factor BamB|nr:PQQ-binding-like beta-propeller repeat protein [Ktedonobacterales bacterium]